MDVYNSERTASPRTDNGEQSDEDKESKVSESYTNCNMEIKFRPTESDASAESQTQARELSPANSVPTPIDDGTHLQNSECNNANTTPVHAHNYQNHNQSSNINLQENGHQHDHEILSKNSSVYDFTDSASVSEESHDMSMSNVPNESGLSVSSKTCELNDTPSQERELAHSVSEYSNHNHSGPQSSELSQHLGPQNYAHSHSLSQGHNHSLSEQSLTNHPLHGPMAPYSRIGLDHPDAMSMEMSGQSYNSADHYDDSLSVVSEYSNPNNCFDGIIRRARGRPRGSKNGTGVGRTRARGYRFSSNQVDDRSNTAYDLRHIPDPFSCQRRGRPRSRFIVDLGEQNHEAWTKAKDELNISDAELTTLLLSLLESRKECKESIDSDTLLSLISAEFKKWKEKFSSQLSMLSHYASIHNTNCCTCLGIKKKKYTPAGTGKRGRPRKYPPPVGYGPGMQRPDTVDDDGNIFEPQVILKDGMIVKAEPEDKQPGNMSSSNSSSQGANVPVGPLEAHLLNGDPLGQMLSRPLTQEEIEKRREYYNNHKNKIKYVCHYCQVHFYHKPNFDYHISKLEITGKCTIVDKVNNLYLCDTCGEGFSWREKLEKHLRLSEQHGTHNQKELLMYGDFQCNMCGKTFNKRTTYLQHVKWHEEREDIPCVICGTMFKQTDLRHHLMEVHSNDSLPCSYCGKLFTSRKYLEKHELVHQGGNFPCPECGKIFTQKCNMQAHVRTHSLDKEYPCEACGQMLNQKIGLCHHLKKHFPPSEFSYECEICAHYFANDYFLKYHKNKVHNIAVDGMPPDEGAEGGGGEHSEYMSSPLSSHMSATDEEREKAYGAANSVVKNMLGASLMGSPLDGVNLSMKHEGPDPTMDDVSLREQSVHMEEHMRHMIEHRNKEQMEQQEDALRLSAEHHHGMHVNDDHLHMPQDLTRMATQSHLSESSERMSHMSDMRSSSATDSPVRMTDTPAGHMDNLGRMSAENFGRMTGTPGGYLAEHIRRMAENQSRMSDSAMSHYDERDNYVRLGDNLRSMSRGSSSAGDPMGRLGDNLGLPMGVIRPSQTPTATAQWPPHMQNHSAALEGMNQSPQSNQHAALYPLPFWPYDPSFRQYHH